MGESLKGQVAIVTGASGGLGEHFARVLAREGAAVALTARRLDKVEQIASELNAAGQKAMAMRLDVADAHAIAPAFDAIQAALGPVSILINNAGVGGEGAALELSIEDFDNTFDVNVRGVFVAAQTFSGTWKSVSGLPLAFFWVAVPGYWVWGLGLGAAALAYYRLTRPACRVCGG